MIDSKKLLVFDVNETLLDIESLRPFFQGLFQDGDVMREWFAQLVLYSQTITLAGLYVPFGALAAGALRMTAEIHEVHCRQEDVRNLHAALSVLPAHPEAAAALALLHERGCRMVTLTNSPPAAGESALERAGLARYFERNFSVHEVRRFKPAPQTYQAVAHAMGVEPEAMCLVAAHVWDTLGAQALGASGVLIARQGNAPLPVEGIPQPDYVATDLMDFVEWMTGFEKE